MGYPPGWEKLTDLQRADIDAHINGLTGDEETYPAPAHGWTCFHCGATLRTKGAATLHFGALPLDDQRPVCVVPGSILWPLTLAALEADRAPWPKATWAVPIDALSALLKHVEATSRPPNPTPEVQAMKPEGKEGSSS